MMSRPAYKPPIAVVACITAVDTKTPTQAIHSDIFRPKYFAVNPAVDDDINAPKIISEDMSCCRSGLMFQPNGVKGAFSPNTCTVC
jgi:hypothetical protein